MPDEKEKEKDFTPGFDFSEKVDVEGKERKIELAPSGLYVFDKNEKFEAKRIIPEAKTSTTGVWVGVKHPFSGGKVLVSSASRPSDFRSVKVRGRTIKGILSLTKKR